MIDKVKFNKMFCLDVDGKLKGYEYLVTLGIYDLFCAKFARQVCRQKDYMMVKRLNHIPMRVSGHTIKLYLR